MAQNNHAYREQIEAGLREAYSQSLRETVALDDLRLIVFSDLHRGAGDGADDFRPCRKVYHAALAYYYEAGYRLFLLGDVEELWERILPNILTRYQGTLELERRFFEEGRCERFIGNHDESLRLPWNWSQLEKYLGGKELRDSLTLEVTSEDQKIGELFFAHGHQGIEYSLLDKFLVRRFWAPIQKLTGWGVGIPSSDHSLRQSHEQALYGWAARQPHPLILICGHTHHPVFMSTALEQYSRDKLERLRRENAAPEAIAMANAELHWVLADIDEKRSLLPDAPQPCYFNTGCCSYNDGTITGLEIANGQIRLVRWTGGRGRPERLVTREALLEQTLTKCAASVSFSP